MDGPESMEDVVDAFLTDLKDPQVLHHLKQQGAIRKLEKKLTCYGKVMEIIREMDEKGNSTQRQSRLAEAKKKYLATPAPDTMSDQDLEEVQRLFDAYFADYIKRFTKWP